MMPRTVMRLGVVALALGAMALPANADDHAGGAVAFEWLIVGSAIAGLLIAVSLIARSFTARSLIALQAKRAGFLGRATAFVIDLVLVNVVIAAVGLAATELTGGSVRVANTIDDVRSCSGSEPIPPELSVPREFAGGDVRRCTRSVYGFAYDRTLVVRAAASSTIAETDRKQISITIDANGRPVHAFYLDSLTPLVLAAYLLLLEWRYGATLGKRIVGIRVVSLGGGPIDLWQAGKRSLLRGLVVLCTAETQIGLGMTTAYGLPDLGLWSRMLNLLALIYLIAFAIATLAGALPLHDRWAGTQVVPTRDGGQER